MNNTLDNYPDLLIENRSSKKMKIILTLLVGAVFLFSFLYIINYFKTNYFENTQNSGLRQYPHSVEEIEEEIYNKYSSCVERYIFISPTLEKFACLISSGNRYSLIVNGIKETELDTEILPIRFIYSKLGGKYGYIGKLNGKDFLVINGKEEKNIEYDSIKDLWFSLDGSRYAYLIRRDKKYIMVIDGKEEKEYDHILDFTFSPDGSRYAYIAKRNNKTLIVVDGIEGKEYDEIFFVGVSRFSKFYWFNEWSDNFKFSSNGKRFGYVGKIENKECIVIDGVEKDCFDNFGQFKFSDDSKRVAYYGINLGKGITLKVDEKEIILEDIVYDFKFNPKDGGYGYITTKGGIKTLIINDTTEIKENCVGFIFSSDGKNFACISKKENNKYSVVINRKSEKTYDKIIDFAFGPNCSRYMYYGRNYLFDILVVDGKEIEIANNVLDFKFSPNCEVFGYIKIDKEGYKLVVNGKEGKIYKSILDFEFTPDGNHYVYVARKNNGKSVLVVNDVEGKEYDEIFCEGGNCFKFSDEEKYVTYLARIGDRVIKVKRNL